MIARITGKEDRQRERNNITDNGSAKALKSRQRLLAETVALGTGERELISGRITTPGVAAREAHNNNKPTI